MKIQISDHFDFKRLLCFVLPSIAMMIFTSVYGVVDGLFVSNYAGKTAFAAVNLIMPFPMLLGTAGFMIGTGGTAIVAKKLGEGEHQLANEYFSMLVKALISIGIFTTITGLFLLRPFAGLMGASDEMLENAVRYGRLLLLFITFFMLQNFFQSFLVTAEKPKLGLIITVIAGLTNMFLDWLFVGISGLGITGAALATGISQMIGGGIPLLYFLRKNNSLLQIGKSKFKMQIFKNTCINGSSELMTNASLSIVNMLYNHQLMKFAGENGVAAYGTIMYVAFIFVSIFIGYSIGSAPLVGYHYGADHTDELKNLFRKSLIFISISGVLMLSSALLLSGTLANIFVGYDADLYALTRHGFTLFSLSFLIMGFNIYSSAFFTALGNGVISAAISFLRTLLFQMLAVLLLPVFFGLNGVWMASVTAEIFALIVSIAFLIRKKNYYHYL